MNIKKKLAGLALAAAAMGTAHAAAETIPVENGPAPFDIDINNEGQIALGSRIGEVAAIYNAEQEALFLDIKIQGEANTIESAIPCSEAENAMAQWQNPQQATLIKNKILKPSIMQLGLSYAFPISQQKNIDALHDKVLEAVADRTLENLKAATSTVAANCPKP